MLPINFTKEDFKIYSAVTALRTVLWGRDDLLRPQYKAKLNRHPLSGHCYVACEYIHHYWDALYLPHYVKIDDVTHWFLQRDDVILDPTEDQFVDVGVLIPYSEGIRCGFLTKKPSRRTASLVNSVMRITSLVADALRDGRNVIDIPNNEKDYDHPDIYKLFYGQQVSAGNTTYPGTLIYSSTAST